ncbi:putative nucleotidyltransferase, ribonuclease H [Tanacetum coccineum]
MFERTRQRKEGNVYADTYDDTKNIIEKMRNYNPPEDESAPADPSCVRAVIEKKSRWTSETLKEISELKEDHERKLEAMQKNDDDREKLIEDAVQKILGKIPPEVVRRVGEVSYRLALSPQLSHVHNEDLYFVEEPEVILDRQERVMRKKVIHLVKVLWKNHPEREATWENEEMMRTDYPHFFSRFDGLENATGVVDTENDIKSELKLKVTYEIC